MMNFVQKLRAAQEKNRSWLCVGLDPTADHMPPGVDVSTFSRALVEATADLACAYKPNLYFYLTYGAEGLAALRDVITHMPNHIPVILDAKLGDIGYTATHYGRFAFETLGVDAVTVTPYVGMDAVQPLLEYPERMVFVLARSSNRTGNDFQMWPTSHQPLYRYVTAQTNTLAAHYPDQLGLMVGATQPADLIEMRSWAPNLPFLIPGLGTQEGDLDTSIQHGITRTGIGPVLSVTRAINYASQDPAGYVDAARAAAQHWVEKIRTVQGAR